MEHETFKYPISDVIIEGGKIRMAFQGNLLSKTLVIGIIFLFIGSSTIPSTAWVLNKNNALSLDEQIIVNDVDVKIIKSLIKDRSRNIYLDIDDRVHVNNIKSTHYYHSVISVDDIYFTNPLNNDILRAGDSININGTIKDKKFKNYIIEYGQGINPTEWLTTGITLIDDGNSPIEDGTVAIWDTSHITEPDFYTLRITTNLRNRAKSIIFERPKLILFPLFKRLIYAIFQNNMRLTHLTSLAEQKTNFIKNIYLDPTLKEGWPKRIPCYEDEDGSYYLPGYTEPVVCDINNDGEMEILVFFNENPLTIYAYKPDGSYVHGWPVRIENEDGGSCTSAPTFADLDNNGYDDIIVHGERGIYVYNYDGSLQNFISLINSAQPTAESMVFDLDNDGDFEIIKKFEYTSQNIAVFDSNGTMLDGWPQIIYDWEGPYGNYYSIVHFQGESVPAVGNFDDDTEFEIVVACCRNVFDDPQDPVNASHYEGRVLVYDLDGSILNGYPVDIDGCIWSSPAVGDIDNDGYDEIIVGSQFYTDGFPDFGLYVLDRFGNNLSGWPQLIGNSIKTSPALADLNRDGYLEIIASTRNHPFRTYVFDYEGNVLAGWPQETIWRDYRSPVVGDVNDDENLDILTTAGSGVYPEDPGGGGVYAWNLDGSLIEGFPKVTEVDAQAAVTISDIDNDGKIELITSSDWDTDLETNIEKVRCTIYVWELTSDFVQETMEWPMFHHDPQHTGYFALDFPCLTFNWHPAKEPYKIGV